MSNPLLELIAQGESGMAGYNAYNRGTYTGADGKQHIRGADHPIDFSRLTMGQVQDLQHAGRQDPDRLFAVGKYQVIPKTMNGAVNALGIERDEPFTPELQDRIFSEYLIVDKRPDIHAYITGKQGVSLLDAQRGLAAEWASFGDPDKGGRSRYGGANHASITLEQSATALNQMRAEYRTFIDQGMSPQEAWRQVTSSTGHDQTREQQAPRASQAGVDGMYRQGEKGEDIRGLQEQLNQLGYPDAQGRPLSTDGDFGDRTLQALLAFQQANGLKADGIAGPRTLEALKHAEQAPLLSNPNHPQHALYQQSYEQLRQLDPKMLAFTSDRDYRNAAATLAFEAGVSGLTQVDHVVPSGNGAGLIAVQGRLDDPAHSRLYVDKAQAASQPLQQSTRQIEQDTRQQAQQAREAPRQPEPRQRPDAQALESRRMAMI